MRKRFALPALALLTLMCSALPAHAGAWSMSPGEYYSGFLGGWFSSDNYYDQNGNRVQLAGGGLWEERSLTSYSELGWKKSVSFVLGIPAVSVTRQFGQVHQAQNPVPTASGLADALIGFKWRIQNGRSASAIELDWQPPLGYERNQFYSHADSAAAGDYNGDGDSLDVNRLHQLGSPVLGDGQQNVTLRLLLGTAVGSKMFVEGSGGYRYRFEEDFADQILVNADLGYWLGHMVLVGGQYLGEFTAAKSENPSRDPERQLVGPILVFRVDERLDMIVQTLHTAAATNALHTDEIRLGVAFRQNKLDRLQGFLGGGAKP